MPKITIDNKEVEFQEGMTVMQACEVAEIEIPRFCYHDKLSIAGNCRMCLVEMDKSPKPIASCAMPAGDGMIIKTNSEKVIKARQGVMEFLLINHPLDCPICDQGGECDLQDQALHYGFDKSRYKENKRAIKNKNMGPLVSTIMTRCIHCTRCVRFSTEVAGVDDLGLLGRGENAEITSYLEKTIKSELSGNVIDLCPVGALTSKPYAFKSRPWELHKTETHDVFDAMGSNIRIDSVGKKALRVLPIQNDEINEDWISDKSRFAIDGLLKQRIDMPYKKIDNKLVQCEWDDALNIIVENISTLNASKTTAISGKFTDIETLYSAKNFLNSLGSNYYDCRYDNAQFIENQRSSYLFNSSIQKIDESDCILLVGSNPRWEASVLNSRIRKAYLNNNCEIGLIGKKVDLNYKYEHLSENLEHLNEIIHGVSLFCKSLNKAKKPLVIVGNSAINYENGEDIIKICAEISDKFNKDKDNWNSFNILQQDISKAGALDLGFYNSYFSKNFELKLETHLNENKPVVFLLGCDELDTEILSKSFVVYIGHHGDISANIADIILPSPAYTEKSSTFVNLEGRVILTSRCFHALGSAKDEWKIFRSLSNKINKKLQFNNINELRNEIIDHYGLFQELNVLPKKIKLDFKKKIKIHNKEVNYNIKNFYMNDSISRASTTMANCTKEILNKA